MSLVITDCNNPGNSRENRIYMGRLSSNALNSPSATEYGMLFGIYIDTVRYGVQMVITMSSIPQIYTRGLINETWGNWVEK